MARAADRHLTQDELEALVSTGVPQRRELTSPGDNLGEISSHLVHCEKCRLLAENYAAVESRLASLKSRNSLQRHPDCPPDEEWPSVAAGLLAAEQIEKHLQHAANCDHCGPLLRRATEDFATELTADEESVLNGLKSSDDDWQRGLAERLSGVVRERGVQTRIANPLWRFLGSWPRLIASAGSLVLVVFCAWWILRLQSPKTPEYLLAEAYTQQRTLELRIPGARYAPLRVERSGESSRLSRPAALLEVEALIARNIAAHPNDPSWLQVRGRAELLDGNYSAALESLQHALQARPEDPSLLLDVSTAHFQRAEAESLPQEYGVSTELLSRVLLKQPDNPVALFNRAIVSDRLFLYEQEEQDWQHYLRVDPAGDWATEAKHRLSELHEKMKIGLEQSPATVDLEKIPAFLASRAVFPSRNQGTSSADLRNSIDENYLVSALTEWLPKTHTSDQTPRGKNSRQNYRPALSVLARLLKNRHGDDWLADLLSVPDSRTLREALVALARSINANSLGDPSNAEVQSRRAEALFRVVGAKPGVLRAQLETVYSLHRAQLPRKCLTESPHVLAASTRKRYPWIRSQLLLEIASCYSMIEQLDLAAARAQEALSIAAHAGYGALWLRSIGIRATIETNKGNFTAAWSMDLDGLRHYWAGSYPEMRAYQFYSDLGTSPQQGDNKYVALAFARQAVAVISSSQHRAFEAMARYQLAALCGNTEEAVEQYASASRLFSELPQTPSTRIYRLNSDLSLAEIEVARARYADALPRLRRIQPELSGTSNQTIALRYYLVVGNALLESGDYLNAESALRAALRIAIRKLGSLRTDRDRMAWEREAGRAARLLAFLYFEKRNDAAAAFHLWESHRLQPRNWNPTHSKEANQSGSVLRGLQFDSTPVVLSKEFQSLSRETVVSYAVFPKGIAIWVFDDRGMNAKWVDVSENDLDKAARHFVELCATASSDAVALREVGVQLYRWLISPVMAYFEPGRILIFEPDGPIGKIPMQALSSPAGDFLGAQFASLTSPRLCLEVKCRRRFLFSSQQPALVVGAPALPSEMPNYLPPLPDAGTEAADVASRFRISTLLIGNRATTTAVKRELPRFVVFHFAGHALASGPQRGLLLASDPPGGLPKNHVDPLLDGNHLGEIDLHRNQLVVLSACSTGIDEQDGLADPDNILRSLFRAGATRVVASRWNVDSVVTTDFMHEFYGSLLDHGSVAEALKLAEAAIRQRRRTSHPYYWAAFSGFVTQ